MNIKKLPSLPVLQTKDSTLRDAFAEAYNRINAFIDATPSELGAAEETHADTHKTGGTDALSPSDIGAATFAQGHAWKANKAYAAGDMCFATDGTSNRYFECVIGGTSHATTEPTWPAIGGSVTDNTVEWLVRSTVPEAYTLPTATNTVLGGVKVGAGLHVTAAGVLSGSGYKLFTSSGTFTALTDKVYITGCGGGGSGYTGWYDSGSSPSKGYGSGGGGARCAYKLELSVVPGQSYSITIGAGGIGTKNTSNTAGGASSFGALLSLAGGGKATSSSVGSSGGDLGSAGGKDGNGGGTLFGAGGNPSGDADGTTGSGYGTGGSGGYYNKYGGNGRQGFILVEW